VPAEGVDPPTPALRVRCSTLSYAGLVPAERIELPTSALQKHCPTAELRRPKFTNADVTAGNRKFSLPETTVCRSTKGDQYRISGPSYVLAGTAILKRNQFTSSRDLAMPAVIRRLRSVDVIEIDLAGLSLGDATALRDDAHEGKRHWRGENPLVGIPSLGVGAGHFSPLCLGAEGETRLPSYALVILSPAGVG
jgi:hypothetical protein